MTAVVNVVKRLDQALASVRDGRADPGTRVHLLPPTPAPDLGD